MIEPVHISPASGSHPSAGRGARAASGTLPLAPPARPRVAVGLDGALTTGLGVWAVSGRLTLGREVGPAQLRGAFTVPIGGKRWTEEDSILVLDEAIGPDAEWVVCVEDVFLPRRGKDGKRRGRPPAFAREHWLRVVGHVARRRAARFGVPYRVPAILHAKAVDWRRTIGVDAYVARCLGDTKAAAILFLRDVLGIEVSEHNAAEGVCISHYTARVAHAPYVPRLKGPVWFVR